MRIRWSQFASLMLLLAGLAASAWAWRVSTLDLQRQADRDFDRFASLTFTHFEQALQHQLDLLAAFQALYRPGADVTRSDFKRLYDDLRVGTRFPGVQAIQFARRVGPHERESLVLQMRQDLGLPAAERDRFRIHPQEGSSVAVVVVYSEPLAGNELALGHDQAHEPSRRESMERARDNGLPQASAPLQLLQGTVSYVVRLPVYGQGLPLDTVDQRRHAHRGQISGVFRADAMLQSAIDARGEAAYQLTVTDDGLADPRADASAAAQAPVSVRLAIANALPDSAVAPRPQNLRRHVLSHGGRLWSMQVQRPEVNAAWARLPLLLLVCGGLLSVVLAAVVARLSWMRQRAAQLAEQWSSEARQTARRLDAVLDSTVDGVLTLDARHHIVAANQCTQSLFGIDRALLIGRPLHALLCETAPGQPCDTLAWEPGSREVQALRADGNPFPMTLTLAAAGVDGQVHLVATVRDLTEAKAAEDAITMTMQALQQATDLYETMLQHAAFAIVMTDAEGRLRAANPAAERLLGAPPPDDDRDRNFVDLVDRQDLTALAQATGAVGDSGSDSPAAATGGLALLTATVQDRSSVEHELHLCGSAGRRIPVSLTVTALPSDGDAAGGFLFIFYDVTERRELAAQMSRLAYSDGLTGLPNRMQLERDLNAALVAADRRGHALALLFIDLDRFKPINDLYGHAMGDKVLCEVARRLQGALRSTDVTARLGGDEFVVLLPALTNASDCAQVAEKLLETLAQPMHFDGQEVSVGASIGLVTYPDCGRDAETLLRHADEAMYAVKQAGRNGFKVAQASSTKVA
ncbi:MAG: diguanylate cyclase domain-containing protein [Aquabacterium sp.]